MCACACRGCLLNDTWILNLFPAGRKHLSTSSSFSPPLSSSSLPSRTSESLLSDGASQNSQGTSGGLAAAGGREGASILPASISSSLAGGLVFHWIRIDFSPSPKGEEISSSSFSSHSLSLLLQPLPRAFHSASLFSVSQHAEEDRAGPIVYGGVYGEEEEEERPPYQERELFLPYDEGGREEEEREADDRKEEEESRDYKPVYMVSC